MIRSSRSGRASIVIILSGLIFLGAAAAAGLLPGAGRDAAAAPKKPEWKLAIQTWTFNQFTLFEAIDLAKKAGVKNIEVFPGQRLSKEDSAALSESSPLSVLAKVKNKLDKSGVKLVGFGVVGIGKDEAAARKLFDFAKLLGIETITAEPEPDAFDLLDRLTEEYEINVAIHNHPKPSRYWSPEVVLEAVKGHSKRIGACADTGHWMRSGLDPLECLKKLEGRIVSSHLKDLNKKGDGHDVVLGSGAGNVKAQLAELYRQGFSGVFSIEFEHNMDKSFPEVEASARWFEKATEELSKP